jgi:fumarate hydratase class II
VIGNDTATTLAASHGNFELVTMLPVIAHNLLESLTILATASTLLADQAIAGFTVNQARLAEQVEKNPILVTALTPIIGYDKAAEIGKQAYREGRKVSEVAAEKTSLSREEIEKLLDPRELTRGGIKGNLSSG